MDGSYAPITLLPESMSGQPGGRFRHASGDMPGLGFALIDYTGDGIAEIVTTYIMTGASALIAVPVVYDVQTFPEVIFSATLISWAGQSTITPLLRDDGTTAFQLTYPYLYGSGFDHKLLNHPIGREVWAYDTNSGRYTLESRRVDLGESLYGESTLEDRLRWGVNEGERLYRRGDFSAAVPLYEAVRELAAAEGWTPPDALTDWDAFAAFRLMALAALTGDDPMPLAEELLAVYGDTILGGLVRTFMNAYGDGTIANAAARGIAAMQNVDLATAIFNDEAVPLLFPVDARGVQYPAAGVVAYLQNNPAALVNTLADDLTALGFDVINVGVADGGNLGITLAQPGVEAFMLEETVFIQTDVGWRIQLTGANPDGWPVAGDFVD
jgi:hypothetical protein